MFEIAKPAKKNPISISHDKLPPQHRKKSGNKSYVCTFDNCMKIYSTTSHLRRHEEIHIGHFMCIEENCGIEFKTRYTLKKHIDNIHLKKKPKKFKCSHCDEQFNRDNWLSRHIFKKHTGIQPYECTNEGCGKRFLVPSKLKRHMKVHKGKHTCTKENCGKIFSTWSLLCKHRTVSHPTVHKCHECEKKFSTSYNLKCHMKIHKTKREVFLCPKPDCMKFYMKESSLNRHIQSFHGRPFVCIQEHCHKTFKSEAAMIAHCSKHNPNKRFRKLHIVGKSSTTKRSDIKCLLKLAKGTSHINLKQLNYIPSSSNQPVNSTRQSIQIESSSNSEKVDISSIPVNETEISLEQENSQNSLSSVSSYIPTLSSVKSEITDNFDIQSDLQSDFSISNSSSVKSEIVSSSSNSQMNFSGMDISSADTSELSRCKKKSETSNSDTCDEITILPTPTKPQPPVIALDDEGISNLTLSSKISPRDVDFSMQDLLTRSPPVIPAELLCLLHDLSCAVIKNNPNDILSFSASYFQQLIEEREKPK